MKKRKYLGRSALIVVSLTLMLLSVWEICIRLDAMYAPLKMFFSMAFGEGIPFRTAMNYFDYSIFEAPLWLTGCIVLSVLAIALPSRRTGAFLVTLFALAMALYGLGRESAVFVDFWRLMQPALLLMMTVLSAVQLITLPRRRKKRRQEEASPRMTDAPRLRRLSHDRSRKAG